MAIITIYIVFSTYDFLLVEDFSESENNQQITFFSDLLYHDIYIEIQMGSHWTPAVREYIEERMELK